jgi:beta-fructofuranosidase
VNDPNGLHRGADGLWHLYYQYNPSSIVAGDQHWGHATSHDLYHWENQKIALWPFNSTTYVYSGSAVVDSNNTSGFFPNQNDGVVAMYTIAAYPGLQTQNIAYSRDGGYTFTTYAKNPVINIGSPQFRDPQLTWHADSQQWVVAVSHASEFKIEFYSSKNLIDWTPRSNFSHGGLLGIQYECPNLVEMPVEGSDERMWVLYISINPGAPLGGSVGQYFPGTFDGDTFTPIDHAARIADFGKDNYAGQFFWGVPGNEPQVSVAWASNWQYTQVVPTAIEGWRSQMSLPRHNYLKNLPSIGYVMVSEPYNIQSIFSEELAYKEDLGNSSIFLDYSSVPSGALYFEANITGLSSSNLAGTVNFTFSSSVSGEFVTGGTFVGQTLWIDRGHTYGFDNPYFTDKFSTNGVYGDEGTWTMSGVIDRTIMENFLNGGEQSATNTFYPMQPLDTMRLAAAGISQGAKVSVGVWALEDAWAQQANSNGTVYGNGTANR